MPLPTPSPSPSPSPCVMSTKGRWSYIWGNHDLIFEAPGRHIITCIYLHLLANLWFKTVWAWKHHGSKPLQMISLWEWSFRVPIHDVQFVAGLCGSICTKTRRRRARKLPPTPELRFPKLKALQDRLKNQNLMSNADFFLWKLGYYWKSLWNIFFDLSRGAEKTGPIIFAAT